MEIKRILWPTDFSENAAKALPYVTSLSEKYGSEIHILYVMKDYPSFGAHYGDFDPDEQEKMTVYNQLVANAVMLQTVADQTRVLHELHLEGYAINEEDLEFLSPYVTRNLKRFGEYDTRYKTEPVPDNKRLPI